METTTSDDVYEAAARAWADRNHNHLCGCARWPDACASGYVLAQWDTEATDVGVAIARAQRTTEIVTALRERGTAWCEQIADMIERGEIG